MLTVFPNLLSYNQLSPFLIRVTLGIIMVYWSYISIREQNKHAGKLSVGIVEGISGILLIIGLWTQVAALVIFVDLAIRTVQKIMKKSFLTDGVNYYFILLIMAASLVFMSAGLLAFDLPL
ncbi:MAG: hypothetical protein WCP09_00420 [Candidatus Taylorbacteria bacterium]